MKLNKPKFWDNPKLTFFAILFLIFTWFFLLLSFFTKFKSTAKFEIPIICVGNIYIGGTGKTPLTIEIYKILKLLGKNPGFVKKYYDYLNDEIEMLKRVGETFVNKNRKKAISFLIDSNKDIAILDDGFQDFSIKKDISILCFNSKQWIGNGLVIPSGPLREKIESIKRADCILINGNKNKIIEEKINKVNNKVKIFYSKYKIANLDQFKNKKILAFAGIGNPSNFFDLLKENNINIIKTYSFADHHNYTQVDLKNIKEEKIDFEKIVTTEKDYFRINDEQKKDFEYVKVILEIENKNEFINLIKSKI